MSIRRAERRQATIDEVVATALAVMESEGAAGLSLGEVAKRMGMRTPSLYGYFSSKAALCDEIFARGWEQLAAEMAPHYRSAPGGPEELMGRVAESMRTLVGWALDHRACAELMFWRPVHGWEPSSDSYRAAVRMYADLTAMVSGLQATGALRSDVATTDLADLITVFTTGVISQQLSNEPGVSAPDGRFTARLDDCARMFCTQFAATEGD